MAVLRRQRGIQPHRAGVEYDFRYLGDPQRSRLRLCRQYEDGSILPPRRTALVAVSALAKLSDGVDASRPHLVPRLGVSSTMSRGVRREVSTIGLDIAMSMATLSAIRSK